MQEDFYDLVGLPQALGEGGKELHSILRMALYDFGQRTLLNAAHPRIAHGFGEAILQATLDEAQLTENFTLVEESCGSFLVVAVYLVQTNGTPEQEVESVVQISRGEDNILCRVVPFDQPDAQHLEVFRHQTFNSCGAAAKLLVSCLSIFCFPFFHS